MRNLTLLHHKHQALPFTNATHSLVDHNNKECSYIITCTHIYKINADTKSSEPIYILDEAIASNVVAIEHLSLNDELCMATGDGEIIVLNLASLQSESVAFCDGGIDCMSWSPDQEVVLFLTKTGVLVVMDTTYTSIYECDLKDPNFGDQAFVNVGWGRKETQFHGTEGKAAAKQKSTDPPVVDVLHLDRTVSIVWRGDSEFFAISFVSETSGRMFKVFDKEGRLQFTSETTIGLEAAICWRPSGSWIAIPQRLPNKYVIALFEKNGLKHREIVLPLKTSEDEYITKLEWSSDSDVLAIATFNKASQKSIIYLYTMGNYHWYQKQTLVFTAKIASFGWDARYTEGKQLHVLLDDQKYSIYRWEYTVSHSNGHSSRDAAMVAVIDGARVRITNFRGAVIPPPMCSFTLDTLAPINCIAFPTNPSETDDPNAFFIVDTNDRLTTMQPTFVNGLLKNITTSYTFVFKPNVSLQVIALHFNHWTWLSIDAIAVTQTDSTKSTTLLYCKLIDDRIEVADSLRIDGPITRLTSAGPTELFIYTADGLVRSARIQDNNLVLTTERISYNDIVDDVHVYRDAADKLRTFALKQRQWLQLDDKQIATKVTSMFLTEKFLLFTTLDRLKFVRLSDGVVVNERRMERGGRLVIVVPRDARTVLQMPRGNLEVIQPRVLSLCIIGELLDRSEYNKAFDILRKQRINLNLLIDHNPARFLQEVAVFIESIDNANWLNLFLSDLENVDVTVSMYSSNYGVVALGHDHRNLLLGENKVNTVCGAVCAAIQEQGKSDTLLLPILTIHVKQKNLELALSMVWQIKQSEVRGDHKNRTVSAQDALKYLLYLVDINELYNVALGMYDFGLVLFVAAKSQKDPKEYLPFLNELQKIDDLSYRSYKIDLYLKRYTKALKHVVQCGEARLPEALELIGKHGLYTTAMRLYGGDGSEACYTAVVYAFAGHLREKGKFRDASLMYERSGDFQQAILSARHILDWQKCVTLARTMGQTDDEIKQLVSSLIPALVENGSYESAAELILRHQTVYDTAIMLLCDGKLYLKALYEAKMNAEHLIGTIIRPHLESYATNATAQLQSDTDQFGAYKCRLAVVRREKLERKQHNQLHEEEDDMFSDTSSMNSSRFSASSRGTGKTHRSSKNRRKHERKLLSLKEGNPFEEIALIDALHSLALKSYDQQQSVRALGKALIEQRMDALGAEMQRKFAGLLRLVRESLDEIWIAEMIVSGTMTGDQGNVDYAQMQEEQHYAMIKPHQRFKPLLKAIDWEFDVLD